MFSPKSPLYALVSPFRQPSKVACKRSSDSTSSSCPSIRIPYVFYECCSAVGIRLVSFKSHRTFPFTITQFRMRQSATFLPIYFIRMPCARHSRNRIRACRLDSSPSTRAPCLPSYRRKRRKHGRLKRMLTRLVTCKNWRNTFLLQVRVSKILCCAFPFAMM